jgi:hypothetical protein
MVRNTILTAASFEVKMCRRKREIILYYFTKESTKRLCTGRTVHKESRGIALTFHDHGTRTWWGVSVTPRPLFTPGKDPVPIVQDAGWVSGPAWTGAESLAPPGFDLRTVQPVARHYIDWATRRTRKQVRFLNNSQTKTELYLNIRFVGLQDSKHSLFRLFIKTSQLR